MTAETFLWEDRPRFILGLLFAKYDDERPVAIVNGVPAAGVLATLSVIEIVLAVTFALRLSRSGHPSF
jgi:hypothetical protein